MKLGFSCAMIALATLVSACTKDKPADTSADSGSTAMTAPSGAPSASAAASASAAVEAERPLPGEHRADNKAAKEITPANYKAELDKVEKEIGPQ